MRYGKNPDTTYTITYNGLDDAIKFRNRLLIQQCGCGSDKSDENRLYVQGWWDNSANTDVGTGLFDSGDGNRQ